ncbi:hypothetical protein SAFG77S_02609 [Streptomyces afghaniensis]
MWELPGFRTGDALASAVLTAAAPTRMAVYDRRVQHALDDLGLTLTRAPGRYGRYMQLLDDLLKHGGPRTGGWTGRDNALTSRADRAFSVWPGPTRQLLAHARLVPRPAPERSSRDTPPRARGDSGAEPAKAG